MAATTADKTIAINRTFDLPPATIWKAWTEPESFKKWWGPNDYTCPYCKIDFRVGGTLHACMKGPDGKEIYSIGTFKEIVPGKRIVVTDNFADSEGNIIHPPAEMGGEWPDNVLITVELEEQGGKTNMLMTQGPMPAAMYDDCIKGWQQCLDKMERNHVCASRVNSIPGYSTYYKRDILV